MSSVYSHLFQKITPQQLPTLVSLCSCAIGALEPSKLQFYIEKQYEYHLVQNLEVITTLPQKPLKKRQLTWSPLHISENWKLLKKISLRFGRKRTTSSEEPITMLSFFSSKILLMSMIGTYMGRPMSVALYAELWNAASCTYCISKFCIAWAPLSWDISSSDFSKPPSKCNEAIVSTRFFPLSTNINMKMRSLLHRSLHIEIVAPFVLNSYLLRLRLVLSEQHGVITNIFDTSQLAIFGQAIRVE